MAAFTGNGYLVANITALLAINASDRPAFKVAILVAGLGWYEYDNTATTGGLTPTDNPSTGRWFPIGAGSLFWTTSTRPASPVLGTQGYNTTRGKTEYYANGAWIAGVFGINFGLSYTIARTANIIGAVGSAPKGVVYCPTNDRVYVANQNNATVSVINPTTNTIVTSIAVGDYPEGIFYSSFKDRIYVVSGSGTNNVSVIVPSTNTVEASITVAGFPLQGVYCPSNNNIYLSTDSGKVVVINANTNAITTDITVSSSTLSELAYCPSNNKIYVANTTGGTLSVVNPSTNTVVGTITVGTQPYGVKYCPFNDSIYVSNSGSGNLSVVNPSTNTVVATVTVGGSPKGVIYSPLNNRIYIANSGSNTLSVIDPSTNTISLTIPQSSLGLSPWEGDACPSSDRVYVSCSNSYSIAVLS